MSKIIGILMLLILLGVGGCSSNNEVDKEKSQEKSENIDLIIDDLDDLIEDAEEIRK